jgi:hypothetical protein
MFVLKCYICGATVQRCHNIERARCFDCKMQQKRDYMTEQKRKVENKSKIYELNHGLYDENGKFHPIPRRDSL